MLARSLPCVYCLVGIYVFYLLLPTETAPVPEAKLLLVQIVWRHGARAPFRTYPTDEFQEDAWPFGFGELTQLGMQQQYELGQYLRSRYIDKYKLLNPRYSPKEVYVRSSDTDRTLVSAQSNLAGMFPLGTAGKQFPEHRRWPVSWTPIPVHTVESGQDRLTGPGDCPRLRQITIGKKPPIDGLDEIHQVALNETGLKDIEEVRTVLCDTLATETAHGLSLPDWLTPEMAAKFRKSCHDQYRAYHGLGMEYSFDRARLIGGGTLKAFDSMMHMKVACMAKNKENTTDCQFASKLKYYAVSGHDITVMGILGTLLGKEDAQALDVPQYTECVAFELWDVPRIGAAVKVLRRKGVGKELESITNIVSGCPEDEEYCPLKAFTKRSLKFMIQDIKKECEPKTTQA